MSPAECDNYLTQLLGQAKVILTGSSDIGLKVQFFDVLRDFFDFSNAWQESIGITVIPALQDYQVEPVSGRVLRLLNVLDQNNVNQPAVMQRLGIVHFLYPYTDTQPMTAIVVKTVDGPLECFPPDFPDWVLPQFGLGLLDGILGRMMMQPNQSYTNNQSGLFYWQRFRDAMAHARVSVMRWNTIGSQAWAFPQAYRTTSQRGGVSTFNVSPPPTPLR